LDIGGACLGLLHALAAAQAFIANGKRVEFLSSLRMSIRGRSLPNACVENLAGFFGDGATAFIVQDASQPTNDHVFGLGEFFLAAQRSLPSHRDQRFGERRTECRIRCDALSARGDYEDGQVHSELEQRSGISGKMLSASPRTSRTSIGQVAGETDWCRVRRFPGGREIHGNLGSSTCGAALHALLVAARKLETRENLPIFLASLDLGLLFRRWLARSAVVFCPPTRISRWARVPGASAT